MAWRETIKALAIGGLLWIVISYWRSFLQKRLRRPRDLITKYGPWAIVTGATGGLGVQFVEQLAEQGFSVVITARGEKDLAVLAAQTRQKYRVEVMAIVADLATPEGQSKLSAAVQDVDVGLIIHNAGIGYVGAFAQQDLERLLSLIQLNVIAPVTVTSQLLPALRKRRRSGVIIISSLAGYQPIPLHAVYAASKSFASTFGVSLWEELKGDNIDVLVCEPGSVATGFGVASGTVYGRGASPAVVVRETLSSLGLSPSVSPGSLFAWLRSCLARTLPRRWIAPLSKWRQKRIMAPPPQSTLHPSSTTTTTTTTTT